VIRLVEGRLNKDLSYRYKKQGVSYAFRCTRLLSVAEITETYTSDEPADAHIVMKLGYSNVHAAAEYTCRPKTEFNVK